MQTVLGKATTIQIVLEEAETVAAVVLIYLKVALSKDSEPANRDC